MASADHVPSVCRRLLCAGALVIGASQLSAAAEPSTDRPAGYPAKPIRFLVGNVPGGGIDMTARILAQKLTDRWGRPVVVDNRGGASGIIAMEIATQAVPDGYTFLVVPGSLIASAAAQKKLSFDVRKAYAPVTQLTTVAYVLMINAGLPPDTLKDFVAYAKSRPNALSYGSSGVGGIGHLASALFCELSGVRMTHVPYKGSGPALVDMIAGQVQMGFTATISGMPHVRAGRLKALGISSAKRVQAFPDIPTIAEAGVPGFDLINWYGLFGPAATPRPIVYALHEVIARELNAPDVQAAFSKDGAEATPSSSPEAFATLLAKEVASWEKLVKLPGFAEHLR